MPSGTRLFSFSFPSGLSGRCCREGAPFSRSVRRCFLIRLLPVYVFAMAPLKTFRLHFGFRVATTLFGLRFERGDVAVPSLRREGNGVVVVLPAGFDFDRPASQLWANRVLAETLRRRAQELLPSRLDAYARRYDLRYNRVVIKNVRTRWGSCSALGNINLSLWLLLAPEHLVDYVIKHELAHLDEMNHGPRFWAALDRMTDGCARALEREMRAFARTLWTL